MLKKQIRITQENEDRKRIQQERVLKEKNEREIVAAAALVSVNSNRNEGSPIQSPLDTSGFPPIVGSSDATFPHSILGKRLHDQPNPKISDDNGDDSSSGGEDIHVDSAQGSQPLSALDDGEVEYHVIRPLLSLPQYEHMTRTKSRPKLRCGMKDCRRHTSYYCVKCTHQLQLENPAAAYDNRKPKVYALCSPMVENNLYCFYRHALGLGEREEIEAQELKASEASRPKRHRFHFKKVSSTGEAEQNDDTIGHV